jgi:hypothetical protein
MFADHLCHIFILDAVTWLVVQTYKANRLTLHFAHSVHVPDCVVFLRLEVEPRNGLNDIF